MSRGYPGCLPIERACDESRKSKGDDMRRNRRLSWGLLTVILVSGGATVRAQQEPADSKSVEGQPVADMGTRFQFLERYGLDDMAKPEQAVGQYRVGIRETIKIVEERPQGAPARSDGAVQAIITERPARVSDIGVVQATVRRYDAYRQTPNPASKPSTPRPLEGMTLWYQPRSGSSPLVLSLTEGRGLRELEYMAIGQEIFTPNLVALLPVQPSRIGDRWSISKTGTWALLGETPGRGAPLLGQLEVVQRGAGETEWEAVFIINGRIALPRGETTVNARLRFRFPAPPPPDPQAEVKPIEHAIVQARGAMTEVRMTTVTMAPLSSTNSRLRRITTQQLTLARQFTSPEGPLSIPESLPMANEENSWLLYDDPEGLFHFRHPQDFHLGALTNPGDSVELLRGSPAAPDRMEFLIQHKTGDAEADRNNRSPDFHVKLLNESWRQQKQDILRGPTGWMPDADWAPYKMKVYRINAALRPSIGAAKRDARVHFDEYVVQFGRDESLILRSTTVQDPPAPFRKQVEAVLKTFRLGPSTSR